MNGFIKNTGILILLLGVVCLVLYRYVVSTNLLLVLSLILECVGMGLYIALNRRVE